MGKKDNFEIIGGRSHEQLTLDIASHVGVEPMTLGLENMKLGDFPSGECQAEILDSIRGRRTFVVQSHGGDLPVDKAIMEHMFLLEAASSSSAKHLTAVIPYLGYARQDRTKHGRESQSARDVIKMLDKVGRAKRFLTMDIHSAPIQGFTQRPFDHLTARFLFVNDIRERFEEEIAKDELVVAGADISGLALATKFQQELGLHPDNVAAVNKERLENSSVNGEVRNETITREIIGDTRGKVVVIVEDMFDTMGTAVGAARAYRERGEARAVYMYGTHPVFSKDAHKKIDQAVAEGVIGDVVTTDTLPPRADESSYVRRLTVAKVFGSAMINIARNKSVSREFDGKNRF